jgi:hypothetical protein
LFALVVASEIPVICVFILRAIAYPDGSSFAAVIFNPEDKRCSDLETLLSDAFKALFARIAAAL